MSIIQKLITVLSGETKPAIEIGDKLNITKNPGTKSVVHVEIKERKKSVIEIGNIAKEGTKSVIGIGDKLSITKEGLQVVGNTVDAITPFIPLIGAATALICDIITIYQQAEFNKKTISALYDRAKLAEYAIETLQRRKKLHEKDFKNQEWYNSFHRFVDVLKEIKSFSKQVSSIHGYQKYIKSCSIKNKFEDLTKDYDNVMKDLNFTLAVSNEEQRRYDNECLMDDVAEMKHFLQTIDGGIVDNNQMMNTVIEELRLMRISLERGKGPLTKPKEIEQKEITEPNHREDKDYRGTNKVVVRRNYKNSIEVACKPFELKVEDKKAYENKQKQLAILSKLSDCTNIIKFYGLANLDGKHYMIEEWAYYGNLKETYENYDISLTRKSHIATDISRAIVFLESIGIYHHDLRCENVMLTKNLDPKLANFEYARATTAATNPIVLETLEIVRWLAPEKMFDSSARYTAKCEIFSFGMLLWELTFEKIPYRGWAHEKVKHHVMAGNREKMIFGPAANERELEIQEGLKKVIKEAWKQEAKDRISLLSLFNTLEQLQSKYKNVQELTLFSQKTLDEISDVGMKVELPECEDLTFDFEIDTMISVEEGTMAHKNREYKKAWECFKYHAENGNPCAKFWMGHYLSEGKYIEKNPEEAAKLFKEAADKGIPDAQFRYAFTLQKKTSMKNEREEFIKYLTMAADGGNNIAQFNIGDIYLNGKLQFKCDKYKGIHYLKLAALQNHPKAIELLEKGNVW